MWLPKLYALLTSLGTDVGTLKQQMRKVMSAQDTINAAMDELRQEVAASVQEFKDDAANLADLTGKLAAGVQGQDTTVDIAATAMAIHEQAMALKNGLASAHSAATGVKTANSDQSVVQGGSTTGPDVVSASSIGTIVPPSTPDESSQAVPSSLGGGSMPSVEPTIPAKDPGSPVPAGEASTEEKPAEPQPPKEEATTPVEPSVPSVEDVPSKVSDTAPESTKS